jgi:hypothetical protein
MPTQLLAPVKHARLDGSDRRASHFRDFRQRMFHTGKLQSQCLLVGKTVEAIHHPVVTFSLQRRIDDLRQAFIEASARETIFPPTYRL